MMKNTFRTLSLSMVAVVAVLFFQQTVQGGPPLICHPIEIGSAKSLPWGSPTDWRAVKSDYDLNRLVDDTLALLTPETPGLLRMETLRRATIYAVWAQRDQKVGYHVRDSKIADRLIERLMERTRESVKNNRSFGIALFDVGYLTSCYNQSGYYSDNKTSGKPDGYVMVRKAVDGYAMLRKALGPSADPELEFGAALLSREPMQPTHLQHLQRALAGAKEGSLLARNLVNHFGKQGQSLADLRTQIAQSKTK